MRPRRLRYVVSVAIPHEAAGGGLMTVHGPWLDGRAADDFAARVQARDDTAIVHVHVLRSGVLREAVR